MPADFDSPWKEALDEYFEPFMALLFPDAHQQIDWSRNYESLDKEFQQIAREAEVGRRYVDKLVKVWTRPGIECWVLIHIEVQTTRDNDFPLRMYVYHYRIFDRYNKPVASLAVLADDDPDWRPDSYQQTVFGCESLLRFPIVKLLDFAAKEAELEANANPFALILLAHLKTLDTQRDPAARQAWKIRLVRGLFERGLTAKVVRELYRLVDWLMDLPRPFALEFDEAIENMQQEKRMPYVTSTDRLAIERALKKGIKAVLKIRFGDDGLKLMRELENIYDHEKLEAILVTLETAKNLDEIRCIYADKAP